MIGTVYSVLNITMYDIKLHRRTLFWKVKIGVEWIALKSSCNTVKLALLYCLLTYSLDY